VALAGTLRVIEGAYISNDDLYAVIVDAAVGPAIMVKGEPVNRGGGVHVDTSSAYVATGIKVPSSTRSIMTMHAVILSLPVVPSLDGIAAFEVGVADTHVVVVKYIVISLPPELGADNVGCTVVLRVCVVCVVRVCATESRAALADKLGAPDTDAEPEK
jgi:hypothetical protein